MEMKLRVTTRIDVGKLLRLAKLADLGSESASVKPGPNIERSYVKEAMGVLWNNHLAKITLATIFRGARFKHSFQGALLPTERLDKRGGEVTSGGATYSITY